LISALVEVGLKWERSRSLAKFEECIQRLETIVTELEKGEVPLDRALELFDEGMKLSASCRRELEEAEGKVEILLRRNGRLEPEAFEAVAQPANAGKS
jgi:exodeoxyribonuclease VII small subunit